MKDITVKNILEVTGGELIIGNQEQICEVFSKDTRIINPGDVYIGIKGETFDGSEFWKQAFEKGASVVIVENIDFTKENLGEYKGKTIIKIKNTLEALYSIARFKRESYNIPVIAVTGSVGKTSTKDIIANVVSQKFKTLKTIGNNNNNIGLPFTILRLKNEEAMVLEMGMNHFGEISLLTSIAKPDICVITNIGTSHIGNLGSRENILKAKLEILEGNKDPIVIVNNDNDLLHNWYEENKNRFQIKTFGIKNKSDVMASDIALEKEKSTYTCLLNNKKYEINVPVGGEHFVLNSLCASLVGETLNIQPEQIVKGIESFELTKKRMDITVLSNGARIINDAYNASFESMQASLKYLSEFRDSRKIAVLGDMFELGDYAEELHKSVGKEVVKNHIDILICAGENASYIAKQAQEEGMPKENIYYFPNKEEIVKELKNILDKNDVVLFKASNGMRFFDLAEEFKKI